MNAILSVYLTGQEDPQRGIMWPVDPTALEPLARSCPAPLVLVANEIPEGPLWTIVRAEAPRSVYFDRWRHYAKWLELHEEIDFAFCVDPTDVICLADPFPHIATGLLYCGSEPVAIGDSPWMYKHHPPFREWMAANASRPLLNAGLAGGDRLTLARFCRRMGEEQRGLVMDMAAFNLIAYEEFEIVTGPTVHTLYKAYETATPAWFKHK